MELIKIKDFMDDFKSRVKEKYSNKDGLPIKTGHTFKDNVDNLNQTKLVESGMGSTHGLKLKELKLDYQKVLIRNL